MEFLKWSDEYSVKVQEIDEQHKKLVAMLNSLYNAYMHKEHAEKVELIVAELVKYTVYHFQTEEKYFSQFNYENRIEHICEHKNFTEKVIEFQEKLKKNKSALAIEVINFLRSWLVNHIGMSDKKYIDCFVKGGLK